MAQDQPLGLCRARFGSCLRPTGDAAAFPAAKPSTLELPGKAEHRAGKCREILTGEERPNVVDEGETSREAYSSWEGDWRDQPGAHLTAGHVVTQHTVHVEGGTLRRSTCDKQQPGDCKNQGYVTAKPEQPSPCVVGPVHQSQCTSGSKNRHHEEVLFWDQNA